MVADNSSYTVTYPDLKISETGSTLLVCSTDQDFTDDVKTLFERYIISSLIFYVQDKEAMGNQLAWLWHVRKCVEILIVDLDTCSNNDVLAAVHKTEDDTHYTVFVNRNNNKKDVATILNAESNYTIVGSLQELEHWVQAEIVGLDKVRM